MSNGPYADVITNNTFLHVPVIRDHRTGHILWQDTVWYGRQLAALRRAEQQLESWKQEGVTT